MTRLLYAALLVIPAHLAFAQVPSGPIDIRPSAAVPAPAAGEPRRGFLARLFAPRTAPAPVAGEPVSEAAAAEAAPEPEQRQAVRLPTPPSRPPLPRLRPSRTAAVATASVPAAALPLPLPEIAVALPAAVSVETTAATPPSPAPLPQPLQAMPGPVDGAPVAAMPVTPPAPQAAPEPEPEPVSEPAPASEPQPEPEPAPESERADPPVAVASLPPAPEPEVMREDHLPGDPVGLAPAGVALRDEVDTILRTVDGVAEPYQLVRTLQLLQDRIAHGSMAAFEAARALRQRIEADFAKADPGVWQVPRNVSAAVIYVLSGGSPAVLKGLLALELEPSIDRRLMQGVLDYTEGREDEARSQLASIDVTELRPNMGAQVALAQSALAVRSNPAEARRLLSMARLLAPGGLVEEAALRREIFVADQLSDPDAVQRLARRYLTTFRHSIYAGNFRNRFSAAITRMGLVDDEDGFRRIDTLIDHMEPAAKVPLYLTVARSALLQGYVGTTARAASRAAALSPSDSAAFARAKLYQAAGTVTDPATFEAAQAGHAASDRNLLSQSDRSIHDAVASVIADIAAGTPTAADIAQTVGDDRGDAPEPTPLMARARAMLDETEGLVASPPGADADG